MKLRNLVLSTVLLAGFGASAQIAQAASVAQGPNCPNGVCAQFAATTTIPPINSFRFTMPAAGHVVVNFNGSLYCGASGVTPGDRVIDLYSAIAQNATSVPTLAADSTTRIAHVLKDEADHTFDPSTSFNLSTTRAIKYTSGGTKTVYFLMSRARQDAGVVCTVYGGSFTVIRTP